MIDIPLITNAIAEGRQIALQIIGKQVLLSLPQGLENLQIGSVVDAAVVRVDAGKQPVLQLSSPSQGVGVGELPVETNVPLTTGSTLTLRVSANNLLGTVGLPQTPAPTQTPSAQPAQPTIPQTASQVNQTVSNKAPLPSNLVFEAKVIAVDGKPVSPRSDEAVKVQITSAPIAVESETASPQKEPYVSVNLPLKQQASNQPQSSVPQPQQVNELPSDTVVQPKTDNIKAVVVSVPQTSNNALNQPAAKPLAIGNQLQVQVVQIQTPAIAEEATKVISAKVVVPEAPNPPQLTKAPESPAPRIPAAYQTISDAIRSEATPNPPKAIIPPAITTNPVVATPSAPQNIPSVQGTVIAIESSGEAVVQTPVGNIKLAAPAIAPVGSQITLNVLSVDNKAAPEFTPLFASDAKIGIAQQYVAGKSPLADALNQLQQQSPELASLLVDNLPQILPTKSPQHEQVNKQASAKLLWFLSGVQSGSVEKWLGEATTQQLREKSPEAMRQLETSFSQMRGVSAEANQAGWQTHLLPFVENNQVTFAQAWVKRDNEGKKKRQSDKENTRFVVEVHFDQLGDYQLDGFVHKTPSANSETPIQKMRMDLIIRTSREMSDEMQSEIFAIYQNSLEATGMEGQLLFQPKTRFSIHMHEAPSRGSEESVMV